MGSVQKIVYTLIGCPFDRGIERGVIGQRDLICGMAINFHSKIVSFKSKDERLLMGYAIGLKLCPGLWWEFTNYVRTTRSCL